MNGGCKYEKIVPMRGENCKIKKNGSFNFFFLKKLEWGKGLSFKKLFKKTYTASGYLLRHPLYISQ